MRLALYILPLLTFIAYASPQPIMPADYSYGYWQNSWRKHNEQKFPDILCIEADRYGMKLNIDNITKPHIGLINQPSNIVSTLSKGTSRLDKLPLADLSLEVEHQGQVYKLASCKAAESESSSRLQPIWLWESGVIAQHYEVQELILKNEKGQDLIADATLDIVAWPHSLTFNAHITPALQFKQGPTSGVTGTGYCIENKAFDVPNSKVAAAPQFTAEIWTKLPEKASKQGRPFGWILCNKQHEAADGHFGFIAQHNKFSCSMNIGGTHKNRKEVRSNGYMNRDKWHQLVLTYDGAKATFYLDGSPQGTMEFNKPRTAGQEAMTIGKRGDKHGGLLNGLFDQTRYWNRALSHNEIRELYNKPASDPPANGLVVNHSFGDEYVEPIWKDATISLGLNTPTRNLSTQETIDGEWLIGQEQVISLTENFDYPDVENPAIALTLKTVDGKETPLHYTPAFNSYTTNLEKGSFIKGGYREIRDYDEYEITVENKGSQLTRVPVYLHLKNPANITGVTPMLCNQDGTPTGIPVQLSKNWHYSKMGAYLRPYMILPTAPGKVTYKLRVCYGFYGKLPAASHSQLSLVGYANNSRWDQLAVGCWGETICFDMDTACVENVVTDVRGLMMRSGKDGGMWNWTDCGWGGDWLKLTNAKNERSYLSELKTAYLAQGPCLTDVRHEGYYGVDRAVKFKAQVQTGRTDDIARTFQNFTYTFNKDQPADKVSFFAIGDRARVFSPRLAFGDSKGIHSERQVPKHVPKDHVLINRHTIGGEGPWWIAQPGSVVQSHHKGWGSGTRALIIRSYKASFGGQQFTNPTISIPVSHDLGQGEKGIQILLTPPAGIESIKKGDTISFDVQWITMPRVAEDYYGPNEHLRNVLKKHPNSWFPIFREAAYNDLEVTVQGGSLKRNYPVMINVEQEEVRFSIKGGVGAVPVTFENISDPTGYKLYRIVDGAPQHFHPQVHGNDYWQTNYNTHSQRYNLVFNVPLDGLPTSDWMLSKK